MWLMLQQDTPEDYVLASDETYSVRQFVEWGFSEVGDEGEVGIEIEWKGTGIDEK